MKKCPKCGQNLIDIAAFCNNCGLDLANPDEPQTAIEEPDLSSLENNATLQAAKEHIRNSRVGMAAVAIFCLIVLLITIGLIGGNGYKGSLKKYMNAIQKGDVETMLYTSLPKDVVNSMISKTTDGAVSVDQFINLYNNSYSSALSALKNEQGSLKITYKISKAEKLGQLNTLALESPFSSLIYFKEVMSINYAEYGFNANNISEAYAVSVSWKASAGKELITSNTEVIIIYKYKGKWYIYSDITIDSIFDTMMYNENFKDTYNVYTDALNECFEAMY